VLMLLVAVFSLKILSYSVSVISGASWT